MIDYASITALIRAELVEARNSSDEFAGLEIDIGDEQSFDSPDKRAGVLRIVARYGEATMNHGSALVPVTLSVMGEADGVKATQALLCEFASANNLKRIGDAQQFWHAPRVSSNFAQMGAGYRALFTVTGYISVAIQGVWLEEMTYGGESVPFIAVRDSTSQHLAPQNYSGSDGRTRSYAMSQTLAISVTMYLSDNALVRDLIDLKHGTGDKTNKTFEIGLRYSVMDATKTLTMRCQSADIAQEIGQIPTITAVFTL